MHRRKWLALTAPALLLPGFTADAGAAACADAYTTAQLVAYVAAPNTCVNLHPGTYTVDDTLTLTQGEAIFGFGSPGPIIEASSTFPVSGSLSVLWTRGAAGNAVYVENVRIDAKNRAVIATHGYYTNMYKVHAYRARCNGVTIQGAYTFTDGVVRYNGSNIESPDYCLKPPGSGFYINDDIGAGITIDRNHIESNIGPAIDVNRISGPAGGWNYIRDNAISGNSGWAAISIMNAGRWYVAYNTVSHPKTSEMNPYNNAHGCTNTPPGAPKGNAAFFMCEEYGDGSTASRGNYVSHNTFIGRYGMLLTGVSSSSDVPKDNSLYANTVYGSDYGCADAYDEGLPDSNRYTGVTDPAKQCHAGNVGYF